MRKLYILLFMCLLFGYTDTLAQERTITGRILSKEDQTPVPGVSVLLKGTTTGTTTDAEGRYAISVPQAGGSLVFSFIGLETQTIEIGQNSSIDLQMSPDIQQLSEVVVVGYASVEKRELTGAVSQVKGAVIENLPLQSFDRAIQGRAAGVQVLSGNGVPGGAVSVRIRGLGSITAGNEPLYIVDGVQLNNRNDGGARVSSNPLAFLNPNDIESIDILKDAANASIYGAQAANGVVIITTRKGKAGSKTNVELNYYKGIVEPVPTLDMLNTQQFIQVRQEALQTGFPALTAAQIRAAALGGLASPSITGLGLSSTLTDEEIAALPTYDWQKEAFVPGEINNYELAVSGGNEATTFYTSLSYNQNDGSLKNIEFDRVTGRLNLGHKVNQKLSFDMGLNLSSIYQRGPYGDARATTAFGAPQYASPVILPLNPIYVPETGDYYGLPGSGTTMIGDLSQNVMANAAYNKSEGRMNQMVANATLSYSILKDLVFRGSFGLDYRALTTNFYGDPRLSDWYNIKGTQTTANNTNRNFTTNYTLNYTRSFSERHNFNGLVGVEYRDEVNQGSSANGQGFPSPDFQTPNAAATAVTIAGFWTGFKRAGAFANFKYDFDKKYLLSVTMRYDGSSRFGQESQYGFFPALSGAWNVSSENFLKNSSVVTDLKLRASWGVTGNDQIGNFDARSLYGLAGSKTGVNFMNGNYDGASGIGPSQMGNLDLRWEKNVTTNIGVDYGLFQGRVRGSVEVFRRLSKDLLLNQSLPQISGFNNITKNVGEVLNEGFEFEVNTTNLELNGFTWETNFNITLLRNEVVSLFDGLEVLPGNLGIRVGYPLGTNTGNPYAGVNPANGRPMHYDINGNITYIRTAADIVPLDHQDFSDMYGGFTNTFRYKGVELSAFFMYDYGRTVGNVQHFRMADNGAVLRNSNVYFYENRWTTPGQITDVPRPANNRAENSRISSYQTLTRFYEDASFIRLKQVTLSYNLPSSLLSRFKISNVRVYAQGVNLLTFTKWSGYDPEFRDTAGVNSVEGVVPQTKSYTFGVQIGL
jgi:TonB-dependent starch-binding outer membrane protein SusC